MVTDQDRLSAQEAVLGSMLIDERCVGPVLEKVSAEDFISASYRAVFQAIRELFVSGSAVDPVTVLGKLGVAAGSQANAFLLQIMEDTPTSANVELYIPILKAQARAYQAGELCREMQEALTMGDTEKAWSCLDRINGLRADRRCIERMNMPDMLSDFYDRHTDSKQYLTWGFPKLDAGLFVEKGDFIVLGGYPSAGKTALAVQMAYHHAEKHRVGFYSLETSRYKLADRLIANIVGVDLSKIKSGKLDQDEWEVVAGRSDAIVTRKLELIEASGMSAMDIKADAISHRYDMVYVDYIQLVEPENRREVRQEQVAGISRSLQQLAHGSGLLVVGLSQLSRQDKAERSGKAEPTMADLRESGQLEQDADAVLLLYLENPQEPNSSRRICKVAKNKDGERGRVYLMFDGHLQRFRESRLNEPTVPTKQEPRRRQEPMQQGFYPLPGSEEVPF